MYQISENVHHAKSASTAESELEIRHDIHADTKAQAEIEENRHIRYLILNASMPINCAIFGSLNWMPKPSLPNNIPTPRNSNNAGNPNR